MQNLLEGLNNRQLEAVTYCERSSFNSSGSSVLGKTKVLTHKVAYFIQELGVKPWNILAITFTNKAAKEMKERITNILGEATNDMWLGTFHSVCLRILRKHIETLGYTSDFAIFDTSDQRTLVKECLKSLNLDDKVFTDRYVLSEISNAKNEMLEPAEYKAKFISDFRLGKIAEVYEMYQNKLKSNNAVDFDDIINLTIKILLENPQVLEYYSDKFKYIFVDEYQDTNKAQFTLITLLASKYGNVTVVGDNNQSIYAFRGADITNILNFEKDFPNAKIIKLEQNYRSTGNILKVANEVIKNNSDKIKKNLWTENEAGEKVSFFCGDNEYDEASYIVSQINYLRREEYLKYSDFAVLYRMNAQSRSIEDILMREGIPYKVIGGQKFYERKEIKDTIAYLRLIQNTSDNISLRRIINEPKRGIGKTSLEQVEEIASQNETSMYEIIKRASEFNLTRVFANSREFIETIENLREEKENLSISDLIQKTLKETGYIKALELEKTIEAETRIQNIDEFLTVAIEFEEQYAENSLGDFLENLALVTDLDNADMQEDSVILMTLHSAKGLEYPVVFMVGMEEGIFPGFKSIGELKELEEERRLCYVGITRARQKLYLTCSKYRTIFGSTSYNKVSRFIEEVPGDLLDGYEEALKKKKDNSFEDSNQEWTYGSRVNKYVFQNTTKESSSKFQFRTVESFLGNTSSSVSDVDLSGYREGIKVYHKKFGEGIIAKAEQEGNDLKLDINFKKVGHKRLMAKFAKLEVIGWIYNISNFNFFAIEKKNGDYFMGIVLVLFTAILFIGIGLYAVIKSYKFKKRCTEENIGTVVQIIKLGGRFKSYKPVIKYYVGERCIVNKSYSVFGSFRSSKYRVNNEIKIFYNPDKIEEFRIDKDIADYLWGALNIILGCFPLLGLLEIFMSEQ